MLRKAKDDDLNMGVILESILAEEVKTNSETIKIRLPQIEGDYDGGVGV